MEAVLCNHLCLSDFLMLSDILAYRGKDFDPSLPAKRISGSYFFMPSPGLAKPLYSGLNTLVKFLLCLLVLFGHPDAHLSTPFQLWKFFIFWLFLKVDCTLHALGDCMSAVGRAAPPCGWTHLLFFSSSFPLLQASLQIFGVPCPAWAPSDPLLCSEHESVNVPHSR